MSILKNSAVLMLMLVAFLSCKENKEVKAPKGEILAQEVAVNLKKVSLDIEGMTCEIGCARTIQSKLSKKEGVTFAEVSFSEKKGIVQFDANKISEKEIIATVEKIAGGDLYKVPNATEVE